MSPAVAEMAALGETVQFSASVSDQNGQALAGMSLSWSITETAVAEVSGSGLVTAVGNGTATITATAGEASGTAAITVDQVVSALAVSPAVGTLWVGDTLRLSAKATDANGHAVEEAEFAWESGDAAIATVDSTGLVTAVGAGEVDVMAASSGVTSRAALSVMAPVPTTVAVTPDTVALTALGQSAQFSASVSDQNGQALAGTSLSWSITETAVAEVSGSGLVTAVGNGTATITATAGEASGTAAITVDQVVSALAVSPAVGTLWVGDTLRLSAKATDANGHAVEEAEFAWESGDAAIATVDSTGLVTAVGAGEVDVMAASSGVTSRAALSVMAPVPTTVAVTPDTVALTALGQSAQFSASVSDQNGQALAGTSLSWSITETAVAEVSGSGLVTAVGNGTATITATAGEASGTAAITVDQVVSALAVSPAVGTLWVGDTLRLSAKATDANGHAVEEAEFAWESGDAAIATVDSAGLVTAVGAGEVDVMAASSGVTSRAALSVMAPVPTTVAVTPDTVALTALGQSAQFGAEVRDQAGRVMTDAVVSWTSGDTTVAVVDSTGSVAAVGNGTATITAGAGEASGHAVALVMQSAGSVIVTPGADSITSGDTLRLSARAFDENGHPLVGSTFDWSSSNGSVATVDASGLVRGVAQGTATIAARTGSTQGTTQITVSNPDRAALVAFYEQTDGPNWEWDTNWLTDAPLDTWAGIDTNEFDRVTRLRFRSGQINGTLPREIGELSELRHLHIASRNLIGEIPPAIGSLANLESLLLGSRLTGAIPPELGNLANLESLVLGGSLTGEIPPALGDLANLRLLELRSVTSAMPPELGKLASLEVLDLHGNLTGSIPQEIGRLHNLRVLELYDTEPTEAGAGGIPPDLGDLTKLETLKIVRFRLTGPIPAELGRLSNLRVLFLSGTQLTGGIPAELGNLSNLREFVSDGNRFNAPLPPRLGKLDQLEQLYIVGSQLPGTIPAELGNLKNLKRLELPRNRLTGPVPAELGKLTNLTSLELNENSLAGGIPRELGGLNELTHLWLRGNRLSGEIPTELGNLTELKQLHLGRNRLTGPIPPELGNLTDLEALYLYENHLTGGVPRELANLTKLRVMSFRINPELSGPFPSGLIALGELVRFYSDDTDLCAPRDAAFLAWLNSVPSQRVKLCGPTDLGAYLTQAVQSDEFPVPLVAGTEALLRVFVTSPRPTSERIPAVRSRFFVGDSEIHVADIAAKTISIPTEIDEGSLSRSSQALIPGSVIQPGLEMVVEIDPAGTLDPALGVRSRIPETGRIVVNVAEMPHFSLTVIPFVWSETSDSSVVASAMGMEADPHGHALLEHTTSLLPIGDLDVTAHAPVVTSSNNVSTILNQTVAIRAIEGGSGNWLGLIAPPVEGRVTGVATLGGGSESASITSSSTIAHELGHNMGLFHAPCGGASWVDTAFPHAKGSIGAWGYDFRGQVLIKPDTPDLMSYCRPRWISDYHFGNALRYRLAEQAGTGASRSAAVRSLLLWGGVGEDGIPYLEPAFVMDAPPTMPRNGGAYRLAGHDASGFELFSIQFEMQEVADANGQKSFAFMVPVETDWSLDLANITLSGPEGSVSLDRDTDHPMTILRSLSNGQVRGILRNVSPAVGVQADAGGSGLDLLFSRGMPDVASWRR